MIDFTFNYMRQELEEQKRLHKKYRKARRRLEKYQGKKLNVSIKKGKPYYYVRRKGMPDVYLGGDENSIVQRIREVRFCDEMLASLESNIEWMECFLESYRAVSLDQVMKRMPKHYCPNHIGVELDLEESDDAMKRYEEMKAHKDTIPDIYPEQLNITAFDGTLVRSRAEALIYIRLWQAGFYVIYEYPIEYERGKFVRSDFLLIHPLTGRIFLWEHLGLWFDAVRQSNYRSEFNYKMDQYGKMGFAPGINLLTSYEVQTGFDMEAIAVDIDNLYNRKDMHSLDTLERQQKEYFEDSRLLIAI